ncbi:DUF721 domain-containing protein [Natranaerofaba carboxydovora]|uniref:DUF721 domain-containing protein n=1 Tax=Natranaerofaba carboxydovora TaxID=2742683 RepID=UPI001F12AA53|nr:DUF721 domain-containing protein [Natranaerofaba carboxydovora]UMZ75191.1 hypothetical protein ACONDI_02806 [Natranaerofaba carboxydovora]
MKPLKDSLNKTISSLGIREKLKEQFLINNWENIVGSKLYKICRPRKIKNGIIFIVCPSPLWVQELTFKKMEIIKKVNKKFNYKFCIDIKFVPGSLDEDYNKVSNLDSKEEYSFDYITIDKSEQNWVKNTVDSGNIEDEQLKLKIKNILEKDIRYKKKRKDLGFLICGECGRYVKPEEYSNYNKMCLICYNYFTKKRMKSIMDMLEDTPWLCRKDLEEYYNDLTSQEYNRIKKKIKDKAVDEVYKAYFAFKDKETEENYKWLKNSLNKYVFVVSGKKPDEIDNSTWQKWVKSLNKKIYEKIIKNY